jgi:hypothetical protein
MRLTRSEAEGATDQAIGRGRPGRRMNPDYS